MKWVSPDSCCYTDDLPIALCAWWQDCFFQLEWIHCNSPHGGRCTGACLSDSPGLHWLAVGSKHLQWQPASTQGMYLPTCTGYLREASIQIQTCRGRSVSSCLCSMHAGGKPSNDSGHTGLGLASGVTLDPHEFLGSGVECYGLDLKCPSKASYVWMMTGSWVGVY